MQKSTIYNLEDVQTYLRKLLLLDNVRNCSVFHKFINIFHHIPQDDLKENASEVFS
jgi:hypothetical protein